MSDDQPQLELIVDGVAVTVADDGDTLLGVLRDRLGVDSVKDGCSPQGQCGCCTVLVDGQPRVACVTPARRVVGRHITTVDGLDPERRAAWGSSFCATGASQCGFCTPGIIVRLDALEAKLAASGSREVSGSTDSGSEKAAVDQALLAHLCRCTGWQTIHEAWDRFGVGDRDGSDGPVRTVETSAHTYRDTQAAAERARLEGGVDQQIGEHVSLGRGGFAADSAPDGSLIAVADVADGWVVGATLAEARAAAGKVQGRRTTAAHSWPLTVPDGTWAATMRTTWVEPAYLETDAAWCEPGGTPSSPTANGGAFGGKVGSPVVEVARELADRHDKPVLALASREDVTRWGPKRPPVAGGANPDGTGVIRVVQTPGIAEAIAAVAPGLLVEEVHVPGPPTSAALRCAGWADALVLLAGARGHTGTIRSPQGAEADVEIVDGVIRVSVRCGRVLDEIVLRSYCIGAAHMAWSWLTSEALTVNEAGEVSDLTVRSFGVLRAIDTPRVEVEIERNDDRDPVNGSDAVFAAVAAAGWLSLGCRQDWPIEAGRP